MISKEKLVFSSLGQQGKHIRLYYLIGISWSLKENWNRIIRVVWKGKHTLSFY